jgi:hypothetical protein
MQLFRAGGVGPWKTYKITENGFKLWSLGVTVGVLVAAAMLGATERANIGLIAGFPLLWDRHFTIDYAALLQGCPGGCWFD